MRYVPRIIRMVLIVLICMTIQVLPALFFMSLGVGIIAIADKIGGNIIFVSLFLGTIGSIGVFIFYCFWNAYLDDKEIFINIDTFFKVND